MIWTYQLKWWWLEIWREGTVRDRGEETDSNVWPPKVAHRSRDRSTSSMLAHRWVFTSYGLHYCKIPSSTAIRSKSPFFPSHRPKTSFSGRCWWLFPLPHHLSASLSLFDDDDFHGIGADVAEVRKREKQRDGIERIKKRDQLARHSHPSLVKINLKLQLTKNQNQTTGF